MLFPVGWPYSVAFIGIAVIGMVDGNDGHADGMLVAAAKMLHLFGEIPQHPIDLFDHGLGEDLHLCTDLDRCNGIVRPLRSLRERPERLG